MQRRDEIIIKKVLSEITISFDLMENCSLDAFLADEKLKRAICMTVINIGELVKNISDQARVAYKQIPWKELAGIRDITAHRYQTLRMEDVFYTVKRDFPVIKDELDRILESEIIETEPVSD